MPILAIDKFGNYYETDPDSSEGDGCKGVTPTSGGGDVTFDGSVNRAERIRQADSANAAMGFAAIDAAEAYDAANKRRVQVIQNARNEEANFNAHTPANLAQLVGTGLKQSQMLNSVIEGRVGLSGNGMTSNGLTGKAGMGRQEMGTQIALGLGIFNKKDGSQVTPSASQVAVADNHPYADQAAITNVSETELTQARLKGQVLAQRIADAKKQASINELEAKAAGFSPAEEGEYIDRMALQLSPRTIKEMPMSYSQARESLPVQTQRVIHPMFLLFLIQKPRGA